MALLWECPFCKYRNPEKASECRKCGAKTSVTKGRVWWIEYYDLSRKRRRERIGPNKRAAEIRLAQVKRELAEGKVLPEKALGEISLREFWKQYYLPFIRQKNSSSWVERKILAWEKHLSPFLGQKKLNEVTPILVQQYRQKRLEQVSPATVNREVAILKHMLSYAVKLKILSQNPLSGFEMLPERDDAWRPLTLEEAKKLLEALPEDSRPVFEFALATGLRIGNIINLRWEQVDLEERKLTIPATETKGKKTLVLPLSDWAVQILKKQKKQQLTGNKDTYTDTSYVFLNRQTGKPYTRFLNKTLKNALKRAGLPTSIRIHDLRHTFATWAIQAGVDFRILKELLGHSTLEMALRYTHLNHRTLLEQVNRIPTPYQGKAPGEPEE